MISEILESVDYVTAGIDFIQTCLARNNIFDGKPRLWSHIMYVINCLSYLLDKFLSPMWPHQYIHFGSDVSFSSAAAFGGPNRCYGRKKNDTSGRWEVKMKESTYNTYAP